MAKRTFRWIKPPTKAWNAGLYVVALEDRALDKLSWWAPQLESYAKEHGPWTDRTANLRQTLAAFAYRKGPRLLALVLRHWMDYGVYIELRHQGRYAIIMRTLEMYYSPMWKSLGGT